MTGKHAKRANQEEPSEKEQDGSERNTKTVLRGVPLENPASLRVAKEKRRESKPCKETRKKVKQGDAGRKQTRIIPTKPTCLKLVVRTFREHDPHQVQQGFILMNNCGAASCHVFKNRSIAKCVYLNIYIYYIYNILYIYILYMCVKLV